VESAQWRYRVWPAVNAARSPDKSSAPTRSACIPATSDYNANWSLFRAARRTRPSSRRDRRAPCPPRSAGDRSIGLGSSGSRHASSFALSASLHSSNRPRTRHQLTTLGRPRQLAPAHRRARRGAVRDRVVVRPGQSSAIPRDRPETPNCQRGVRRGSRRLLTSAFTKTQPSDRLGLGRPRTSACGLQSPKRQS
jgi:hypothetical protein